MLLLLGAMLLSLRPMAAQEPGDKPDPPDQAGKSDPGDKGDKGEKPDKPEPPADPGDKPEKSSPPDKPSKPETSGDDEKPEKPHKTEQPDKPDKPEKSDKPETTDAADKAAKAEASASASVAKPDLAQLYEAAIAARNAGKPKLAVEKLSTLLKAKPDSGDSWWALAWIEDSQAHEKEAMTAWAKAAKLLPPDDPRRNEAAQRAAKIERALRPRSKPPVYHPIEDRWTFLLPTGPSLALALLFLAGVAGLALSRALQDWRAGPGSPQAALVKLCERLRAGDDAVVSELVRYAMGGSASGGDLRGLSSADLAVLLSAAAGQNAAARQALAQMLSANGGPAALWAARALADQPEQPNPAAWVPLLQSPERELRDCALTALAHRPAVEAIAPLQALALTADPDAMRAAAILASLEGATASLVALLGSASLSEVRELAGTILARRDPLPATVLSPLAALVADSSHADRPTLVDLLARCGAPSAAILLDLLADDDAAVRQAARDELLVRPALRPLPPEAADRLAKWCREGAPKLTPELLTVATETVPAASRKLVAAALDSSSWELRDAAVRHEIASGGDEAAEPLLRALTRLPRAVPLDPAQQAHLALVCEGLRGCRVVQAIPELLARAAELPDDPRALATARALTETGKAGEILAEAAASQQTEVRRLAIALLAEHPYPEAAEAVWAELGRGDEQTVAPAARMLGRMRDKRAAEPLRARRAALDETTQGELADVFDVALARLGDADAARRVEAMLARENWADRRAAADFYRDARTIPPRARAVIAEADAHARAEAVLTEEERGVADKLAALGEPVKPSLFDWFMAGWRRREVARALVLLGDADATLAAAQMDHIDELWGQPDSADAIAEIEAGGLDWVRRYLKRKRREA